MRLPFDPVVEYAETRFGNRTIPSTRSGDEWTLQSPLDTLALTVGVCRSNVYKWKRQGVSVDQADRIAVRLGLHPSTLWPDWYRLPVETC